MAVAELTLEESRPPIVRRFKLPNRRSWKRIEREVARWLGAEVAERVPVSGRKRGWAPDIEHPWLALEVKSFAALPPRVREAIDQAVKAAEWMRQKRGEDKLPVGILHLSHTDMGNSLVIMRLKDAEAWFGFRSPRPPQVEESSSEEG